jgi:PAS domain S-box-containing protein
VEPRFSDSSGFAEAVLATLREPLLVLDAELRVVLANRAFGQAFGIGPAETRGRLVYELGGGVLNAPALRALLETVLPQNTSFDNFELPIALPGLGHRVLLLNGRRVYREGHRTELILLAMEDVTELRRGTEAQARLAAIVESSDDAIIGNDLDGMIRSWNGAAERLYGYPAREALGKHVSLIVPQERRSELAAILDRLSRGERVPAFETEGVRRDGTRLQISLALSPVRDASGQVIGTSAIARDVTERIRMEAAVRDMAERLEDISAAGPAVLYTRRLEGEAFAPSWISSNVTAMFGYTVAEAMDPEWWTAHVYPEDRADSLARAAALLATGSLAQEYRFLRQDGSVVWVRDEARLIRDPTGRATHAVGAWMDITERRALEERFLQAQKMESVGQLAGGVAHDFNNLLTVITGTVDLALAGLREGDPLAADLREIQQAARRGAALTQHLLAFSRRQVFQPQILNLNDLLADLEPMLRRLLGEEIALLTIGAPDLGNVRADPAQMSQVVLNLVVNARDAMPKGGSLTLETTNVALDEAYARRHPGVTPGPFVMLAVTDTGVGMDQATREHAFEPFFTTKPAGQGTGLGLATVYGIVKQSGGSIWVYSEPGVGTTFKIYLPRVGGVASKPSPAKLDPPARGTETILLVEDEASLRDVARRMLEAAGYTVLTCGSPGEALLVAERFEGPIHLLITDVVMPAMRGPELAARVTRLHPETRVLYVSGYTANAIVQEGELKEGVQFLSKPFDSATLARRVRQVLDMEG